MVIMTKTMTIITHQMTIGMMDNIINNPIILIII